METPITIFYAALTLFLVMDPIGNIGMWLPILEVVPPRRRRGVIVRENVIALGVLVAFLYFGPALLRTLLCYGRRGAQQLLRPEVAEGAAGTRATGPALPAREAFSGALWRHAAPAGSGEGERPGAPGGSRPRTESAAPGPPSAGAPGRPAGG